MAEMLKVEYDELMARAAELEVPLPPPPNPWAQPPCVITFITGSAYQLNFSAESIVESVRAAEEAYAELAQSLRNAALAYEEVDQAAAEALTKEGSVPAPKSVSGAAPKTGGDVGTLAVGPPPEVPGYDGYYDLRQAIEDIEAPDQGIAYTAFEESWNRYVLALQSDAVMDRFRPFEYWEGAAKAAVEANFEQQKRWLISLGGTYCYQIANQAKVVVEAHKWAITEHPDSYGLYITDFWYDEYGRRGDITRQNEVLTWYERDQAKSEEVLGEYYSRAMLPLALVYPSKPPTATTIDAPIQAPENPDENVGETIRDAIGVIGDVIGGVDAPTGGGESGTSTSPQAGGNMSDMVSSLSDMASSQTDTAADAYADAPLAPTGMAGLPSAGGIKPMSVGAGGGGPSAPLQSLSGEGAATEAAAAAGRPGAGGGAGSGAGGAASGRGGMGGMPMGGAGAGKGDGKEGKAKQYGGEEDIYTEDRAWTSAVIGVRRRNDGSE